MKTATAIPLPDPQNFIPIPVLPLTKYYQQLYTFLLSFLIYENNQLLIIFNNFFKVRVTLQDPFGYETIEQNNSPNSKVSATDWNPWKTVNKQRKVSGKMLNEHNTILHFLPKILSFIPNFGETWIFFITSVLYNSLCKPSLTSSIMKQNKKCKKFGNWTQIYTPNNPCRFKKFNFASRICNT